MVVFITNSDKHHFTGVTANAETGLPRLIKFLKRKRARNEVVVKDYETNGLCPILNDPLLLILGDREIQYVIDCYTVDMSWLADFADLIFLGHHIKFDASFSMVKFNCMCYNLRCTQVIDQKLYQNNKLSKNNPRGFRYQLDYVMMRYLGFVPPETDKSIRNYFIDLKPRNARYTDKHIYYAAGDIKYLEDIFDCQMKLAKHWKLDWWLLNVECPLISVLAECENTGFVLDTKKWKENIVENEQLQYQYAKLLDEELRYLRDSLSTGEKKLVGGIWDRPRNKRQKVIPMGLFGMMDESDFMKAKGYSSKDPGANINWTSDTILLMLNALNLPAPLQGDAYKEYKYLIPVISNKGKLIKGKGKTLEGDIVDVPSYASTNQGWTCGQKAFQRYLVDFPVTPLRKFIHILSKYSRATTELTNFGQNYIDKINPITNRLHTIYRQMNTVNGRLQSGGGNNLPQRYNSQNIPRDSKFRHCFSGGLDKNGIAYTICTVDLTGAEVTFMCDKAEDDVLFEWAVINDDSHSPMVQNVWRHIFLYRAGVAAKVWKNFYQFKSKHRKARIIRQLECSDDYNVQHWYSLFETFIVSKKVNKPYRQAGKNGTFGGVYGMKPKKAAETFNGTDSELAKIGKEFDPVNVTEEEGKVIIYAQRKAIPKTYAMVEANVQKGMSHGYLILNERSNSRIWLPEVVRLLKGVRDEMTKLSRNDYSVSYDSFNGYKVHPTGDEYKLEWYHTKDYEGQLRNVPISGTQADCLKEAMVEIAKYIRENKLDEKHGVALLSQVHDELVYRCPKYMDGQSKQWYDYKKTRVLVEFTFDTPISDYAFSEKYDDLSHCVKNIRNDSGDIVQVQCSFPKFVQLTMIQCANRYLKKFEMKASMDIMDSWTK